MARADGQPQCHKQVSPFVSDEDEGLLRHIADISEHPLLSLFAF